jgi:hypothetical protein
MQPAAKRTSKRPAQDLPEGYVGVRLAFSTSALCAIVRCISTCTNGNLTMEVDPRLPLDQATMQEMRANLDMRDESNVLLLQHAEQLERYGQSISISGLTGDHVSAAYIRLLFSGCVFPHEYIAADTLAAGRKAFVLGVAFKSWYTLLKARSNYPLVYVTLSNQDVTTFEFGFCLATPTRMLIDDTHPPLKRIKQTPTPPAAKEATTFEELLEEAGAAAPVPKKKAPKPPAPKAETAKPSAKQKVDANGVCITSKDVQVNINIDETVPDPIAYPALFSLRVHTATFANELRAHKDVECIGFTLDTEPTDPVPAPRKARKPARVVTDAQLDDELDSASVAPSKEEEEQSEEEEEEERMLETSRATTLIISYQDLKSVVSSQTHMPIEDLRTPEGASLHEQFQAQAQAAAAVAEEEEDDEEEARQQQQPFFAEKIQPLIQRSKQRAELFRAFMLKCVRNPARLHTRVYPLKPFRAIFDGPPLNTYTRLDFYAKNSFMSSYFDLPDASGSAFLVISSRAYGADEADDAANALEDEVDPDDAEQERLASRAFKDASGERRRAQMARLGRTLAPVLAAAPPKAAPTRVPVPLV